jgi:outer membrane receptor protein involved in Fe transport
MLPKPIEAIAGSGSLPGRYFLAARNKPRVRFSSAPGAALLAILLAAMIASPCRAETRRPVSLPAATLRDALYQISGLTGLQVVFADARVAQIATPAISGRMTVREMLDRLTRPLGVRYRFIGPNIVSISSPSSPAGREKRPSLRPTLAEVMPALAAEKPIIVTALRREQLLKDMPMSVMSFSQDMLTKRGVAEMRDLARLTPALLLRHGWGASTNLSVRGIYSNTGSATTSVYIDEVPIQTRSLGAGITSTNIYPALFDLERVEVLRGPQGALFGSGSVGGTVRFLSREPDLAHHSGEASAELALTQKGAASYEISGAVGGPISTDQAGFRISMFGRRRGGWIDRVAYPSAMIEARNSNALTTEAARASIKLRLGETVQIMPSLQYQRSNEADSEQFWSILSAPEYGRYVSGFAVAQPARDGFVLPSLRVTVDLPGASLLSTTSYFRRRRHSVVDYTHFMIELLTRGARFTLEEVPDYRVPVVFDNNQDVFTHEFRATSQGTGPFRWIAGFFLQRARQDAVEVIHEPLLDQALRVLVQQDARTYFGSDLLENGVSYLGIDRSIDWQAAVLGQIDYDIRPNLTLTLGSRFAWTHFSQTNYQDGPQSGGILQSRISHGETPVLPRFSVSWKPAPGQLFYVTASKGMRIGGANAQVSPLRCGSRLAAFGYESVPRQFTSDQLWNYEVGTRIQALGGRLTLDAAAYRFDWKNVQQSFALGCLFRYTGNSPLARGHGTEFSLGIAPFEGLTTSFTGSYTKARYTEATYGGVINEETGERPIVSAAHERLPAPSLRLTAFAQYRFALRGGMNGWIAANGEYAASYPVGYGPGTVSYNPTTYISPRTRQLSVRVGVSDERLDASLFVENLTNSTDALQIASNSRVSVNTRYVTLRPRTIGVRLSRRFP